MTPKSTELAELQPVRIWRCLWCVKRTGKHSWYNERGETVIPPVWAIPERPSDGVCPTCLLEQTAIAKSEMRLAERLERK